MSTIHVKELRDGILMREGAGVKLHRYIGADRNNDCDPILLFDYFDSDDPMDFIGGFPPHPHRGFETVTYLLHGQIQHEDNHGRRGLIGAGDVQWMTAGRGVVHSEMPVADSRRLAGLQFWLNLPAASKMGEPGYQEFTANELPFDDYDNGMRIKVMAGKNASGTQSPLTGIATAPLFFDVSLPAGETFRQAIPLSHQAFVFVLEGDIQIEGDVVGKEQLAVLEQGSDLSIVAGTMDARFLLIAAKKIEEPVARLGPFVMNTDAEIVQAFDDFRNGRF
ncbi:pirin family protein [Legionella sp. CNM-4043-24]|uniref:pirin family protein n=1 Tax=Legionella sp. CNM-4043-24 TaxID=3421646 RepID=UPI00403AC4D7